MTGERKRSIKRGKRAGSADPASAQRSRLRAIGRFLLGLPVSPEIREAQERARQQGVDRWQAVELSGKAGRQPSREYILDLIRQHGVPEHLGPFVVELLLSPPAGRSSNPPFDPTDPWRHYFPDAEMLQGKPKQVVAVHELRRRATRYKRLALKNEPRRYSKAGRPGPRPVFHKARGVWRVSAPTQEARRIVAAKFHRSPHTLAGWEKMVKEGEALMWFFCEFVEPETHQSKSRRRELPEPA